MLLGGKNGDDELVKFKHAHLVAPLKARTDFADDAGKALVVDERVAAEGRLLHRVNDLLVNEFLGRVVLLDHRQHVVVLQILLNNGPHYIDWTDPKKANCRPWGGRALILRESQAREPLLKALMRY